MSDGDLNSEDDALVVSDERAELNRDVLDALATLDESTASVVSLLTLLSPERLDELGGFGDSTDQQGGSVRTMAWLRRHFDHGWYLRTDDGRWVCSCGKSRRDNDIDLDPVSPVPIKGQSRRNSKRKGAARRAAARRRRWAFWRAKWAALWADDEFAVAGAPLAPKPTPDEVEDLKKVLESFRKGVTAMPGLREAQEAADAEELPGTPVELGGYLESLPRRRPGRSVGCQVPGHPRYHFHECFTYEDPYPYGAGVVIPPPAE